ncbi:TRAP transporter small permease subunit [Nitratireductor sp. ZSWI3]|uniref:TRAP transporter small permease subunit n=1 Tax=Nitratireductor sp. ZSWI3 TaxID=2966359 RepID=UPI00214F8DEC|nr:TRAP transporter small permease subunit [Nitratireductor sp. ZSWI3]MCR4265448.1 TRAP transporter small permease subunit [Nitratireductor sp. ZSWI3]
MTRFLDRLQSLCTWPGRIVGWLIVPLILSVCLTVLAAQLGINRLAGWETAVPLFGKALTVNTLLDLQWHIFALIVLFGGVYAFRDNSHVAVDVFSSGLPERARLVIRIFGDLVFLLPFCAIIAWYGYGFAQKALTSGEASTYGGMIDRWVIKAAIPAAFSLLGLCALLRAVATALRLASPTSKTDGTSR